MHYRYSGRISAVIHKSKRHHCIYRIKCQHKNYRTDKIKIKMNQRCTPCIPARTNA